MAYKNLRGQKLFLSLILSASTFCALGQELDPIGVLALRAITTNLDGSGIRVAQPEAQYEGTNWEVNPAFTGRPGGIFYFASADGTATNFPNALSSESGHANEVGKAFYGLAGVATNVAHVDNLEAYFFYTNHVANPALPAIGDPVINQSFSFGPQPINVQEAIDSQYDNYSVSNNTLFVSGVGDGGSVAAPATSYNGIGVGSYNNGVTSSVGPTIDNGRCKPELFALNVFTSYTSPLVAGSAAVLLQAALRGDGGPATNAASDFRTIKALLLNGAVKPLGWTNSSSSPLDARYGAGILYLANAYVQMAGGKNNFVAATTVATGGAHPPNGAAGTIASLSGWNFTTNTSSAGNDSVQHYYFNVSNAMAGTKFSATATLVWNRQQNKTSINNLELFLYNCANSNLVSLSTSRVDNVEHIFVPQLAQGRYDLQVLKHGGSFVSASEPCALAWEFISPALNASRDNTGVALTFPIYPGGFVVEGTTNLLPPVTWSTNNLPPPVLTNGQNHIFLNATNPVKFFRLRRSYF